MDADAAAILGAFAELSPTQQQSVSDLDVTSGGRPLAWSGLRRELVGRWAHEVVRRGYRVGTAVLDLVVGEAAQARAVDPDA